MNVTQAPLVDRDDLSDEEVDYEALWNASPAGSGARRQSLRRYRLDDFAFIKVLGKGSFGKVRVAPPSGGLLIVVLFSALSSC